MKRLTAKRTGELAKRNAGHFHPQNTSPEMAYNPSIGYIRLEAA